MREGFEGYFRPTDNQYRALWTKGYVVFDTSVLLNVYRHGKNTTDKLLEAIGSLGARAWIPHQVALEYHRNRPQVVTQQLAAYDKAEESVKKAIAVMEGELGEFARHPTISPASISRVMNAAAKRVVKELHKNKGAHPDFLHDDPLRDRLVALFSGKTGKPFAPERFESAKREAEQRVKTKLPPGYADADKDPEKSVGDVLAWLQTLEFAKEGRKPILFVTDDAKEDWWLKHKGKTLGPRPELVAEMREVASVPFYLYKSNQFLQHAGKYLGVRSTDDAAKEIAGNLRNVQYPPIKRPKPLDDSVRMKYLEAIAEAWQRPAPSEIPSVGSWAREHSLPIVPKVAMKDALVSVLAGLNLEESVRNKLALEESLRNTAALEESVRHKLALGDAVRHKLAFEESVRNKLAAYSDEVHRLRISDPSEREDAEQVSGPLESEEEAP